jgi:4-hydroxybenzoate polyprenyltransferase
MKLGVWLRLGRVSNLPTVWSNVLAALALSGGLAPASAVPLDHLALLAVAFSFFYVGGMYLNDAFDRQIDARERPQRPIPSGQVSATSVFTLGFGWLALGMATLLHVAYHGGAALQPAVLSGAALAACIVGYDIYHKQNPLSPLLMGLCRVLVYVGVACALPGPVTPGLLLGAAALLCHLIGLTYAAKQEAFNRLSRTWPLWFLAAPLLYSAYLALAQPWIAPFLLLAAAWDVFALRFLRPGAQRSVPQAIVRLIAGIALIDALAIASTGALGWALAAVGLALLTRLFQRYIPGT